MARGRSGAAQLSHRALLRYGIVVSAVWTLIVLASLISTLLVGRRHIEESAYHTARVHLAKDSAFCQWAARHDGVYVPARPGGEHDPLFAETPDRSSDVSASGAMTRLSSFKLLREINATLAEDTGVVGRFTSLQPLRSANAPDPWEHRVLEALATGEQEIAEVANLDGKPHLRVMRPVWVAEGCSECHDYRSELPGGVAGGISVSIPLDSYVFVEQGHERASVALHAVYWLLGIGVVGFVTHRAKSQLREREVHEDELGKAYAYTRSVISGLGEGLYGVDTHGCLTFMNPTAEKLLGWTEPELLGQHVHDVIHYKHADGSLFPEHECPLIQVIRNGEPYSTEADLFIRKDQTTLPVAYISTPLWENGVVVGSVMAFQDITHRKRAEEKIQYLAHHDGLTGLPNRNLMTEILTHNLARTRRDNGALALLFIDLDNFSLVNDAGGHFAGDQLLKMVAERLRRITREPDVLARQGGDEFIVLITTPVVKTPDPKSSVGMAVSAAQEVARRVLSALRQPFLLGGREVFINASMGISIYPEDANDEVSLFKNADTAMYHVKRKGGDGYVFYGGELSRKYERQQKLELLLHSAVQQEQFVVLYQPIVHLRSGRLAGVEALVRWHEPSQGVVSPVEFIPLAERNGLIVPIGRWVLREACRQEVRWRERGHSLFVSVNLSIRQFLRSDLIGEVSEIMEESGADIGRMALEITESATMNDPDQALVILNALHDKGLRLALDDFGTGYSSLNRLKTMPIDTLKIDKSFVDGIPNDAKDLSIIRSTVQMARNLGKEPSAEGIETREQWRFLVEHGCEFGQGYLFSPPVPAEQIDIMLASDSPWFSDNPQTGG